MQKFDAPKREPTTVNFDRSLSISDHNFRWIERLATIGMRPPLSYIGQRAFAIQYKACRCLPLNMQWKCYIPNYQRSPCGKILGKILSL
jgi:hypothetical protein